MAEDEFCPDYVRWADYLMVSGPHISSLRTECLRPDIHRVDPIVIPRGAGILSRDTAWFPFPLRVTYMLLLRRLLPALSAGVSPSCYSSRIEDWDAEAYPWSQNRLSAWAQWRNEYRKAVIALGADGFAVETDITAFYEHIEIEAFVEVISEVLAGKAAQFSDELKSLESLLNAASVKGRGLIQNMDASRFFADVYLRVVDDRVRAIPELTYLRWVDDIRLVARTRGAVMRGSQRLESHLKRNGLFLNSKKTALIDSKNAEWSQAQDATHDFTLARCDALLRSGTKAAVEECLQIAGDEMSNAAGRGDDRHVRAYGGRLVRVAEFGPLRTAAGAQLERVAIDGFRTHPGDGQQWSRFGSPVITDDGAAELNAMLRTQDHNCHPWTNMWIVITMGRARSLRADAMDTLRSIVVDRENPSYLRGWAAVVFARHGDGLQRREVVDACLGEAKSSVFLRRAAVVAAQQLPPGTRSSIRSQTLRQDPVLALLWDYLDSRPRYDWYVPQSREFAEPGTKREIAPSFEAVGLVNGQTRRFRAYSLGTDYEVG